MQLEIILGERTAKLEILERNSSKLKVRVDDKEYELDALEVEPGVFSILHDDKSYQAETSGSGENLTVQLAGQRYDLEILDAMNKYRRSRGGGELDADDNMIASPMPGKVTKILVKEGDRVNSGDTVIIVEAMKMESEYKAKLNGTIASIKAQEGEAVDGGQVLVVIDHDEE